jgi:hypothetical protein
VELRIERNVDGMKPSAEVLKDTNNKKNLDLNISTVLKKQYLNLVNFEGEVEQGISSSRENYLE